MSRYLDANKDEATVPPPPRLETLRHNHAAKRIAWSIVTTVIALAVAGTIGYSIMG